MTVNLKDFKAMLGLCESLGTHIKLSFDSPGNPLVAEPHFAHAGHGQVCVFGWAGRLGGAAWQFARGGATLGPRRPRTGVAPVWL